MVPRKQFFRVPLTLGIAALLAMAFSNCSGATRDSNVSVHTGTAYAGIDQVAIRGDDGWFYDVPSDVMWTDASGTWREGDRPACLPATGQSARVSFASTQVTVNGITWRPVVWISCQSG